jgi:hypothetical protein
MRMPAVRGYPYACALRLSVDTDVVGERPYLTTKIITLSEFFNFVHQVSRRWKVTHYNGIRCAIN